MKTVWHCFAILCAMAFVATDPARTAAPPAVAVPHRSPMDLALVPGTRLALSANHTADSVSLVNLETGKVVAERPCGRKPAGVACSADGRRVAVSNLWSDSVSLFEIDGHTLTCKGEFEVGHQPRGLVFAPDSKRLYLALAGDDEVVEFDWVAHRVQRRWPAAREPRRLALTRDGHLLVVACSRSAQVRCFDTRTGKQNWDCTLNGSFNVHGLTLSNEDREIITSQVYHRNHPIVPFNIEQGWAVDNRLARLRTRPAKTPEYDQIALDVRSRAVGDPAAVAVSSNGNWLVVAGSGTQELILIKKAPIPWVDGEPGDFLDGALDDERLQRLPVGGRPLALAFVPGSDQVVVANYLLDALQVVDVSKGTILRTIPLGAPATLSLARRGEAIFHDARRSHHHWFSCHTCHPDGHTSSRTFDTLNDETTGPVKLTPTLRGVSRTGPWTWHGWQESLSDSIEKSLTETMWGPAPKPGDVQAVLAYLHTLDHPQNPHRKRLDPEALARGKALFQGEARCARCHQGEDFTSKKNYDVKMPSDGSPFDKWNPPSLRGLYDRGPYLHEGQAETLDDVLRGPHAPEKLGGKALTPEQRRDLILYLRTL